MLCLNIICFLLIVTLLLPACNGKTDVVKICVPGNPNQKMSHTVKYCDLLARSKRNQATCVFGNDRLDCLRLVSDRIADFTVLQAEDLLFGKAWAGNSVHVVSEIRALKKNPYEYGAVVMIRNDKAVPSDLAGAKICHPGWPASSERGLMFTQYLEERLAPQLCNQNLSVFEDRLRTSTKYFGAMCKAGTWSEDTEEDRRLKMKYPSLCSLCDDPGTCSSRDKYWGAGGAATCLKDGAGDVLWAEYNDVRMHFKLGIVPPEEVSMYSFLCEDGTTQPINATEPCLWLARPWQVVAANRKSSLDVQKTLDVMEGYHKSDWEDNLRNVMESYMEFIINLPVSKTPEDYLETIVGYMGASDMMRNNCNPRHQVTWCTMSRPSHNKCVWIAGASAAFGFQPPILCIPKSNILECLQSVKNKESDVVVVPPDYLPDAILNYSLTPLFYEDFRESNNSYHLNALVKKDSKIKKISDLYLKKACFTMHNGLAWRAAIVALREEGLISTSCNSRGALHGFFGEVCVSSGEGTEDLPLCCNGTYSGMDPDIATYNCLARGGCDVAFLQKFPNYSSVASFMKKVQPSDFRPVCKGEKSQDCSWAWAAPNVVMIAKDMADLRYHETFRVLNQVANSFVSRGKRTNVMFDMFGPFQEGVNIIFQDTSEGLITKEKFNERFNSPDSFDEILNKTIICSSASSIIIQPILLLVLILSVLKFS